MNVMLLAGIALTAPLFAQVVLTVPTTAVLASLTIKPEVDRAAAMKVLPEEVRETVKLYLDGKIQQWYSRADGKGVVFVMNCSSVAEAQALMNSLPLSRAHLANIEYTPLGPLSPLRLLIAPPRESSSQAQPQP